MRNTHLGTLPPSSAPAPADPPATRRAAVLVHAGLMALAVGVVALTFGGGDDHIASASSRTGLALGQPGSIEDAAGTAAVDTTKPRADPMPTARVDARPPSQDAGAAPTPAPADVASASLDTASTITVSEAPPPKAVAAPQPTPPVEAMLAIPAPDQAWPVRLPSRAVDEAYAEHGSVYGLPGAARIVYVIDASGSLVDTLPFVLAELQRALRSLRPDQSYAVLFIAGDGVKEVPPVGMKRATASTVTASVQWVDPISGHVVPSGSAVADAALRRAMAYEPDAVVLLSDSLAGRAEPLADHVRLINLVDTANTAGSLFHTVQLAQPDPVASDSRRGTMELIALRTGGRHRFVSEAELSQPAAQR